MASTRAAQIAELKRQLAIARGIAGEVDAQIKTDTTASVSNDLAAVADLATRTALDSRATQLRVRQIETLVPALVAAVDALLDTTLDLLESV